MAHMNSADARLPLDPGLMTLRREQRRVVSEDRKLIGLAFSVKGMNLLGFRV